MRDCQHSDYRSDCGICQLKRRRAESARVTGGAPGRCIHLGGPTSEEVTCTSCRGNTRLKLYACAVHRACTLEKRVPGTACCDGACPDRRYA